MGIRKRWDIFKSQCVSCGYGQRVISMSCKSPLCLRCGKVYVDNWVSQVSKILHEGVIYRHIVLTMPEILRPGFYSQCGKAVRFVFSNAG